MNVNEGRIRFRNRSFWEATDLGTRLIAQHPFYYLFLFFCTAFPVYLLLTVVFWQSPFWVLFFLWWLKPMFEGGLVQVLSIQVFAPLPPFGESLRKSWRALFRPRIVGDLLWRRFSYQRSVILPITMLEQLSSADFRKRSSAVSVHVRSPSSWLTIFGFHLESIILYSFILLLIWIFLSDAFGQSLLPQMKNFNMFVNWFLLNSDLSWWHIENILYFLTLMLWTPFYVAMGFCLYLQARTVGEAWDIRLTFRRLNERIANKVLILFAVIILSGSLMLSPRSVYAENLPNQAQVEKNSEILRQKPFIHLQEETNYCWQECEQSSSSSSSSSPSLPSVNGSFLLKAIYWSVWILGILLLLYVAYRLGMIWWFDRRTKQAKKTLPEKLFGLDLSEQSLPENIAETARKLFHDNPRLALSLLYRGLLFQILNHHVIDIRKSDTEYDILRQIKAIYPQLYPFSHNLTQAWVAMAYAHVLPELMTINQLCDDYNHYVKNNQDWQAS